MSLPLLVRPGCVMSLLAVGIVTYEGGPRLVVRQADGTVTALPAVADGGPTLTQLLMGDDLTATLNQAVSLGGEAIPADRLGTEAVPWRAPLETQEVWACGVTYKRSKTARMEESDVAASVYDRVYTADRPEIFFKATPHRVRGCGDILRIRTDSAWNVPEPEMTLVVNPAGRIVGVTIGNDMSSRDIEGENPLYLPQAKVYDDCCGLGPWIVPVGAAGSLTDLPVKLEIDRDGATIYCGETNTSQMARRPEDLVSWLFRDNAFPAGVFVLTGTGIVPDSPFTLAPGDVIRITIESIGTLVNTIVQRPPA